MTLGAANSIGEWGVVATLLIVGIWLVVKRERWARDVYALEPFGSGGVIIVTAIGVLTVIAAVWLAITGDSS